MQAERRGDVPLENPSKPTSYVYPGPGPRGNQAQAPLVPKNVFNLIQEKDSGDFENELKSFLQTNI